VVVLVGFIGMLTTIDTNTIMQEVLRLKLMLHGT